MMKYYNNIKNDDDDNDDNDDDHVNVSGVNDNDYQEF